VTWIQRFVCGSVIGAASLIAVAHHRTTGGAPAGLVHPGELPPQVVGPSSIDSTMDFVDDASSQDPEPVFSDSLISVMLEQARQQLHLGKWQRRRKAIRCGPPPSSKKQSGFLNELSYVPRHRIQPRLHDLK